MIGTRWYCASRTGAHMIISASNARAQLFPLIQQVNQDQAPVTITSNAGNAVLVSESEWESMLETAFLLRTASNRAHLEKSIAQLQAGKGIKRTYKKGETLAQLLALVGTAPTDTRKKTTTPKTAVKKSTSR